jgi:LPS-assembly protein
MVSGYAFAHNTIIEPIKACVLTNSSRMTPDNRLQIAKCLGWQLNQTQNMCYGNYNPINIEEQVDPTAVRIMADRVSLYPAGLSQLNGHVDVQQAFRVVNAQTANVYRDAKTQQVIRIELVGDVRYLEPGRLMWAEKATINPKDRAGTLNNVLYRFDTNHGHCLLPAWGKANFIERFSNQDYHLRDVTYTTCSPLDRSWFIAAHDIRLNQATQTGVARGAMLHIADHPIVYLPYFSFPTSNARKSGWLMPISGYSNIGGFDFATPYYLNIAPNYDATLMPHLYTRRGLMLGGEFRFLTQNTVGVTGVHFLPQDSAFNQFIIQHRDEFPVLNGQSSNRWSFLMHERTQLTEKLDLNINFQQVSDAYYLQDFSTNLATLTENQLLREGKISYNTDHWIFRGMLQSYQTLHPVNQSMVANIYERLPQILANGLYGNLPLNGQLLLFGQIDNFHWTDSTITQPQGPRYHANPILSLPQIRSWGYITPQVQLVENYYQLTHTPVNYAHDFNRTIPRFSLDTGLNFEKNSSFFKQTLEPRIYYLNVPYQNQSEFPAFDSAYMIFNTDQLFRTNRFSGFDRISDANQLAYALTSRLLTNDAGVEQASVTVGQLRYFSKRRVQLCYAPDGNCTDSPLFLGYTSPLEKFSPVASAATLALSPTVLASANYVWDPYTRATNNSDVNLHYQPSPTQILGFGYSYLVNGNVIVPNASVVQQAPLHQATFSYAWPFTEKWSSLGVYSQNISKGYAMVSVLGIQYDTCCWAARLLGGRTFQSLSTSNQTPLYNNNIYIQVLLKGLGSVANSDPSSIIQSYLPGYENLFKR